MEKKICNHSHYNEIWVSGKAWKQCLQCGKRWPQPKNPTTIKSNSMENVKQIILKEYEKGNIVFYTIEGLSVVNLKEFIKQPVEGLLYDLNRDEATVLAMADDPKWVNDFAVCKVITALKKRIEEIECGSLLQHRQ